MDRYTDTKRVVKLINEILSLKQLGNAFILKGHSEGLGIVFKNEIGFSRIAIRFLKYNHLVVSDFFSTLHFSELENYIYPFMKEYGLTTQKLEDMVSMYIPSEYVKFNFTQWSEPNYYDKFKFYSDADIEPFVDFLVQYYHEQHLPFVNAFDSLEKYYNYFEYYYSLPREIMDRLNSITQNPTNYLTYLYHKFNNQKFKQYTLDVLEAIESSYSKESDNYKCYTAFIASFENENLSLENLNILSKKKDITSVKKVKVDSLTINLEDDIGEGNNCYVRLIEDLASLFGDYFTPTEISENWEDEEHLVVLVFRIKHAVYEFYPKDNGQYLDEEIIHKAYRIAQINKMPEKLYGEVNEDPMSLILVLHVCLESEVKNLEKKLNIELYEFVG
jgi:hypothetical protein